MNSKLGKTSGEPPSGIPPHTAGLSERERRKIDWRVALYLLPATAVLLLLFIYPFLYGVALSFHDQAGKLTLANYVRFFTDPWQYGTLWNTLRLALPVTLVVIAMSVPIAYKMREKVRGEKAITALLTIPITLGTVLVAEGILGFFGVQGWFNQILMWLGIVKEPLLLTHNYTGTLIALVINGFPFSFLMILGYTSGIDPNLENSARALGAGPWQVFKKVMLPLMAPGIAFAASLEFLVTFSVYPSAVLVGDPAGSTRVIAMAAYQAAFEQYNQPFGSAIAIIMALVQLAVVVGILYLRGRFYRGSTAISKG